MPLLVSTESRVNVARRASMTNRLFPVAFFAGVALGPGADAWDTGCACPASKGALERKAGIGSRKRPRTTVTRNCLDAKRLLSKRLF